MIKGLYKSRPASLVSNAVACVTLFFIPTLTLLYPVILAASVYAIFAYSSIFGALILGIVLSTPFWHCTHWLDFGKSYAFETWRRYFDFCVYKEADLKQSTNVILAIVPHGLFPLTLPMLSAVCDTVFPEFKGKVPNTAVANAMFWAPIMSPIIKWLGCISANPQAIRLALQTNNCIIVPDGIAGAFHSKRKEETLYIQSRKGFIRLALQEGALLVPVYCFGHTQLYDVYPSPGSWIERFSRWAQFSLIFFIGERWLPSLPLRVPLVMAIGKGIKLGKCVDPPLAMVDLVHADFVKAVKDLYYKHRRIVSGYENKDLIVR